MKRIHTYMHIYIYILNWMVDKKYTLYIRRLLVRNCFPKLEKAMCIASGKQEDQPHFIYTNKIKSVVLQLTRQSRPFFYFCDTNGTRQLLVNLLIKYIKSQVGSELYLYNCTPSNVAPRTSIIFAVNLYLYPRTMILTSSIQIHIV